MNHIQSIERGNGRAADGCSAGASCSEGQAAGGRQAMGVERAGSGAAGCLPGLSPVHIWPREERVKAKSWQVHVAIGGQVMQLKASGGQVSRNSEKREAITGFSRGSRRRLMLFVGSLDQDQMKEEGKEVTMITLTYPMEFVDPRTAKLHLFAWKKRFLRRHPGAGIIWKLEPQKRGAPHFHLLVFGSPDICDDKAWVSRSWFEVVGSGDEKHLRAGTNVERVNSWNGVMSYASKYIGKLQTLPADWTNPGRFWGKFNEHALPITLATEAITPEQAVILRRAIRSMQRSRRRRMGDFKRRPNYGGGAMAFIRFERAFRLISHAKDRAAGIELDGSRIPPWSRRDEVIRLREPGQYASFQSMKDSS